MLVARMESTHFRVLSIRGQPPHTQQAERTNPGLPDRHILPSDAGTIMRRSGNPGYASLHLYHQLEREGEQTGEEQYT